jgi:hypothetical protein
MTETSTQQCHLIGKTHNAFMCQAELDKTPEDPAALRAGRYIVTAKGMVSHPPAHEPMGAPAGLNMTWPQHSMRHALQQPGPLHGCVCVTCATHCSSQSLRKRQACQDSKNLTT